MYVSLSWRTPHPPGWLTPPPRDGWLGRSAFVLTKRTCWDFFWQSFLDSQWYFCFFLVRKSHGQRSDLLWTWCLYIGILYLAHCTCGVFFDISCFISAQQTVFLLQIYFLSFSNGTSARESLNIRCSFGTLNARLYNLIFQAKKRFWEMEWSDSFSLFNGP